MQEKETSPHPAGLAPADVYYALFRRKWLIASFAVLGVVAAIGVNLSMPRVYQSEAQLYIRYVVESRSPSQAGPEDRRIRQPDETGENVINNELAILSSLDLAQQVADAIGAEKLLGQGQGGSNRYGAAVLIQKNLRTEAPRRSNVIRVAFQHSDPGIVQLVLGRVIDFYFKKHAEIHAVGAFDEFLTQETDQLRSRLMQTEEQLRLAKAKAGVISLEETKLGYTEQINRIRQELLEAEAQLAERKAAADRLAELLHTRPLGATNETLVASSEKIAEYRRLNVLLDNLKSREQELLLLYTPSNSMLKGVQGQIAANESLKRQLELENPGLLTAGVSETRTAANDRLPAQGTDVIAEMARVAAIESRVKVLSAQLDKSREEATAVNNAEVSITVLQRQRDLEEQHYRRFIENLEQSRIDEKLGSGKVSNISMIQKPSPPLTVPSKRLKATAGALFGGLIGGLALAFLLELYLDHSLKRPVEVENRLGVPLFLSIPEMARNGKSRRLKIPGIRRRLLKANGEPKPAERDNQIAKAASHGEGPASNSDAAMRAFSDALRDRLTLYFEVKNLTHKPKLVALTSCSQGAGVTTIAAGLAASLSEGGDGNVLLVDMTAAQGAAHHYYRGKLECGLDDALESEKRSGALMQDNLYVVSEGGNHDNLPRMLPKRFTNLVPKLKASDYDYIIFDMPPISQISITPKLARFMDAVLMVVESGKTDREAARRAVSLLQEAKTNVGVVMNKHRTYVPRRLTGDV